MNPKFINGLKVVVLASAVAIACSQAGAANSSARVSSPVVTATSMQVTTIKLDKDTTSNAVASAKKEPVQELRLRGNAAIKYNGTLIEGPELDFIPSQNIVIGSSIKFSKIQSVAANGAVIRATSNTPNTPTSGDCGGTVCSFTTYNGQLFLNGQIVPGNVYTILGNSGEILETVIESDGNIVSMGPVNFGDGPGYPPDGGGDGGGDGE